MKTDRTLTRFDWLVLLLLALSGLVLAAISVNKPVHPAEDAAMLMRYAQHVSQGQGIVWNIGQPPVDGATDFLFMMVLAALYSLGAGLEASVLWLGALSHLLTVLLVYFGIRRFFKGGSLIALLSAVFLLFGPGLRYAEASFGTTFFALLVGFTWLAAQFAVEQPKSIQRAVFFALSGLLMGLTRPEGVLIAGLMLLAILFRLGWKQSSRIILIFTGIFLLLGGAYFFWRWHYFGYPLPNPYYKKGGGQFYNDSLAESANGVLELSFPFWLVFAWGSICLVWVALNRFMLQKNWFQSVKNTFLRLFEPESRSQFVLIFRLLGIVLIAGFILGLFRQSSSLHESLVFGRYSAQYAGFLTALLATGFIAACAARWMPALNFTELNYKTNRLDETDSTLRNLITNTVFTGIPVLGFTLMWILLSNEMNYLWRFQYPILPVLLMSWPLLGADFLKSLNLPEPENRPYFSQGLVLLTLMFLGGALVWSQINRWKIDYQSDGRFEVAQFLSQYQSKGYSIATTEAGLLPLYSGWKAVDTWGLNDQWIAHNGGITPEYLAQINPEIIVFHADFSPVAPRLEAGDAWSSMTLTLDTFARQHAYTLAAVYGASPVDTHYYYVRPNFPESQEIITFIQSLDGGKYQFGPHTFDYNKLTWKKDSNAK